MKKIIILIAVVLINTTGLFAGNDNNDNSIQNTISAQLKVPADILSQNYEKVNIEFSVKSNGKASIKNIETQNSELKKLIIEQFPKIDFSKIADLSAGSYKIDVYFQTL